MGNAVADLQPVLAWLGLGCSLTESYQIRVPTSPPYYGFHNQMLLFN